MSAVWGTRDAWHYLRVLGRCMMVSLAVMLWTVPLAWSTRARGLLLCTLAFLVVHAVIPHKELRFILPALPLLCVLCVVGLEAWEARMPGLRNAMAAGLVVVALLSLSQHGRLTRYEIGLEDHVNDGKTA